MKASSGDSGAAFGADRAERLAKEAGTMPATDPRRTAASVAMFERLSEHWSLRGYERETLLGGISKSTWSEWKHRPAAARVKSDTRERIANLFIIDLNAHALFAPEFADRWIREPNAAFADDLSPMGAMLRGRVEDVIAVRRYLERVRTSSPSERTRPRDSALVENRVVSYLPGDAVELHDKEAGITSLRQAVEVYERLAREQPFRYEPALAAALTALASCLTGRDDEEALDLLRRAAAIHRHGLLEGVTHPVELLRSLIQLGNRLSSFGEEAESAAVLAEAHEIFDRWQSSANRGTT
jgi:hypothetical protein